MWIDMSSILFLFPLTHFTHPLSPASLTPPRSIQSFWLPIILAQTEIYTKRHESENHLALSSGAPMASKSEQEPELCSSFFSPGFGSHSREGRREKAGEGLNVVVGAEAGMCPLYLCPFVGHDG